MLQDKQPPKLVRLTQDALNKILVKHEQFRSGRTGGARANLAHHDLTGLDMRGRDLAHADFTRAILLDADFSQSKLDYCLFFAADCRKTNFSGASMVRIDLRGACLRGAIMTNADLTDADMREGSFAQYDPEKGLSFASDTPEWKDGIGNVDMRGATLSSAKLSGAIAINSNFEDANLSKATFVRGDLSGANLSGANLVGADLSTCNLKDVSLRNANLVGAKINTSGLVNVDLQGVMTEAPAGKTLDHDVPLEKLVALHKAWLESKGQRGKKMDLQGYDLRGIPPLGRVDLTMFAAEDTVWYEFDFSHMNIQASRFKNANLRNCHFDYSDMRGTNFSKANLTNAKLRHARLEPLTFDGNRLMKTDFSEAMLRHADFTGANLRFVDFSGADLSFADFSVADLRGANFKGAILEKASLTPEEAQQKGAIFD